MGSHSNPGFNIKLIVSPSFTLYSCTSLVSDRALPLSKSLWASAGGALAWVVCNNDLICEMVSEGEMLSVYVAGGLLDLNVTVKEAAAR